MKYLVMEVHPAYAIVLDEEGRFLKVANFHYQVGDRIDKIVPLRQQSNTVRFIPKAFAGIAAAAACIAVLYTGYYQPNYAAYGTMQIEINPQIELTLSKNEKVLDMQGLNADGQALLQDYSYRGKDRQTATDELIQRAVEMGYLAQGGDIWITVYSSDSEWQQQELQAIDDAMEPYRDYITVDVSTEQKQQQPTATPQVTASPQPTVEPQATATPQPTAVPQATATPQPTVIPQPTAVPDDDDVDDHDDDQQNDVNDDMDDADDTDD